MCVRSCINDVNFFSPASGRGELAMHFTSDTEYVAMAVARDLTWSATESPNIKDVLPLQRQ